MPNGFSIRDGITPELIQAARRLKDKQPILEAMGQQVVSLGKRAFSDDSLRPAAWAPRKKPAPHSLLRKSGALWHSIRVLSANNTQVVVGSDRVYAAIQQLGSAKASGRGSGIPPRPYLPFTRDGAMTTQAQAKVRAVALAKIAALLKTRP